MTKNSTKNNDLLKIPRIIIKTGAFLSFISTKLAVLYCAKLFTTPLKYKIPKREIEMDSKSVQKKMYIPSIQKKVCVYEYGQSDKKILLVHGWSGRGTQLYKFADELLKLGYSTISFDAPAHGKSGSKTTIMLEFIAVIQELEKQYGGFDGAIGHSLGGMSMLNAVSRGVKIPKMVVIGCGDTIQEILDVFVSRLNLNPKIAFGMKKHFEKQFGESMENYAGSEAAKNVKIPTLVIHDENDYEVLVACSKNIYQNLGNGTLEITQGLGHRKILGNAKVIEMAVEFVRN
jgi:pimeloyl-ACP methyl ester carboxylesterase